MVRVADTSVLYAVLDEDDDHHDQAVGDLEDPEPILVPREILVETVDLVRHRADAGAASAALDDLLALPHVSVAEPVHVEAVQAVFDEAAGDLSLADAVVVQTCLARGADPLAYDEDVRAALD